MIVIRSAEVADLRAVKAIDLLLFGEDSYPLFVLRQFYDIGAHLIKVAELSGAVVAYILAHHGEQKGQGWLLSLGVLPEHRGKRIGEKLMAACMAEMEKEAISEIFLTVHPENKTGITIYTRLGFEVRAELPDYFLDDRPRLLMGRRIEHP